MNARSIKKRLMRNRRAVLWGARAYLSVRIPRTVYPDACPDPPVRDGSARVARVFSGSDPRERALDPRESPRPWESPRFVESEADGFSWWEGWRETGEGDPEPLRDEVVARHRDWDAWVARYVHGMGGPTGDALVDAILRVNEFSSGRSADLDSQGLIVTWSVKWRRAVRKRGFATALARVFRVARERGISLRVLGVL